MLDYLFNPKSIAIIGASRHKDKTGYGVLNNILQYGYAGKVFPVNPNATTILSHKSYPTVLDIPEEVDLAVVVIPRDLVLKTIIECGQKKVKGVIIITAGFREENYQGLKLEHKIKEIAKKSNIRILGPNCFGILNTFTGLNATFSVGMPPKGNISFISQSGALCTSVLDWAQSENIGFAKFINLGNKLDLTEIDFLRYLMDDTKTKVITAYLEGIENGEEFIRLAKILTKKKPLIIIKAGSTKAGQKASASHTGALAGSKDLVYDTIFRQCGVIRANSISELFDYAISFSYTNLPVGKKVGIVTNAGGLGIMAADACEKSDLKVPELSKPVINKLKKALPTAANLHNPVDIRGDADSDKFRLAIQTLLSAKEVDGVIILLSPRAGLDISAFAKAAYWAKKETNKPILASFVGEDAVSEGLDILNKHKIPHLPTPERAVDCMTALVKHKEWLKKKIAKDKLYLGNKEKVKEILDCAISQKRTNLYPNEAISIASSFGFTVPKTELAISHQEAVLLANKIGYPVVLKISSHQIMHKTDLNLVKYPITNDEEVYHCYEEMWSIGSKHADGIIVQEMVKGGSEVIIGMTREPQFGPLIMFGLGGVWVEVLKDVAFRIAPFSKQEVKEMVKEIKGYPILKGIRGKKGVDINFIIDSLLKISSLAVKFPQISEIDINPLIVHEQGVVAVDVKITIL